MATVDLTPYFIFVVLITTIRLLWALGTFVGRMGCFLKETGAAARMVAQAYSEQQKNEE